MAHIKQLIDLPGYCIKEKIFEGNHSQVYRARRNSDGLAVILKIPTSSRTSIRENLRYRHEYTLLSSLDLSKIIRVYSLLQYRTGFVIVEEDYGACDL